MTMRLPVVALAFVACVLCTSCFIPPREGPPTEPQPWRLREFPDGRLVSGFNTFVLTINPLKEGPTSAYGGGFGGWSGGDSHYLGRTNARYRFSIKGEGQPLDQWLTYEIRELNQCAGKPSLEQEWAAISATGAVSDARNAIDSRYGAVTRYDRLIAEFKFNAARPPSTTLERLEAGALFKFDDRVYNIIVFQVSPEQRDDPTLSRHEQKFQFLRGRLELLLGNIKIERGNRDMCEVITSAEYFSRNKEAVAGAVACAINPYKSSWPPSCRPPPH